MNRSDNGPELSAVLPTGKVSQSGHTIRALGMQGKEAAIELVVLYEEGEPPDPADPALEGFHSTRFIEYPTMLGSARARVAGARAAAAPLVVFCENHCYPRPGWARALLDASRDQACDWAAIGPQLFPARPADREAVVLITNYTDFIAPAAGGEREHLPGHNSAYRREALLELGDELDELIEAESVLQARLRERGHRLLLEPRATVAHGNFTAVAVLVPESFQLSRVYAATRSRRWSRPRRLAAAAAAPLIVPPLFVYRWGRAARRLGRGRAYLGNIPVVVAIATSQAFGESCGYLLGIGSAAGRLAPYEYSDRQHRS